MKRGDEIFKDCDSIVLEADIDPEIIKAVLDYSKNITKSIWCYFEYDTCS